MVQTSLKIGHYEAWVEVENQKIEHYRIDVNEETKVVTCWIASTAGKRFKIWMAKYHSEFDCVATVHLDGSSAGTRTLFRYNEKPRVKGTIAIGEDTVRPFLFGVVNLTDDESLLNTQSHEELGTIKVVINRITNIEVSFPGNRQFKVPEYVKIHEGSKKSATHQVTFGVGDKIPKRFHWRKYNLKESVATFTFHYRSLDMLKAQGIVPTSGKRKAELIGEEEEEEEKPVVEVSDPEDEEDKRKEAQLEAELERIRQARLERHQDKHAKKKVKCEPKPVFLPGEVIDLTI